MMVFQVPLDLEGFTDTPLTNMRKTIAKRLTESKVRLHVQLTCVAFIADT